MKTLSPLNVKFIKKELTCKTTLPATFSNIAIVEVRLEMEGFMSNQDISGAVLNALPKIIEVKSCETPNDKTMRFIAESRIKSMEQELKQLKSFINNFKH